MHSIFFANEQAYRCYDSIVARNSINKNVNHGDPVDSRVIAKDALFDKCCVDVFINARLMLRVSKFFTVFNLLHELSLKDNFE